ncbi:hypothetical protein B0H63DRAFT_538855 [Podospora didyma]|uniref:Uncharacterized protein n=1 Tax=Podospora didyma TaxID=330526 RepID=A0AAE0NZD9_9PEZI|nr:hypothetical protein B0H63DRAFT_538855 [Podospora didyma]
MASFPNPLRRGSSEHGERRGIIRSYSSSSARLTLGEDGAGDTRSSSYREDIDRSRTSLERAVPAAAASTNGRKAISTSVTSFFSKLRPSKRPERGGTTRAKYVDDHLESSEDEHVPANNNPLPVLGVVSQRRQSTGSLDNQQHDSDTIPTGSWNTPLTLPRRTQSIGGNRFLSRKPVPVSAAAAARPTAASANGKAPRVGASAPDERWAIPMFEGGNGSQAPRLRRKAVMAAPPMQSAIARSTSKGASTNRARELFFAKQEARRQRRNLKESGDFLGVTGVNPYTREMDVLTPTTSSDDAMRSPANSYLAELAHKAKEAQEVYKRAKRDILLQRDQERREKVEKQKETIRQSQQRVHWRCEEGQWSSVAEPKLSPIAQSQNSVVSQDSDSTTVHRSPDSFLGVLAATEDRRAVDQEPLTLCLEEQQCNIDGVKKSGDLAPRTSSLSKTKTIRLRIAPVIPRRLGPTQEDTSPTEEEPSDTEPDKLIVKKTSQQPARYRFTPSSNLPRIPSGRVLELSTQKLELENQDPAKSWASTLIQDLDELERSIETNMQETGLGTERSHGLVKTDQSAYIRTTTTIGYARSPSQPHSNHGCDEMLGMFDDGPLMVVSTEQMLRRPDPASPQSSGAVFSNICLDLLASPSHGHQSAWPSAASPDLQAATATTGRVVEIVSSDDSTMTRATLPIPPEPVNATTSSGQQHETLTEKSERLSQPLSPGDQHKDMRKSMRKNKDEASHPPSASSLTCTSTCRSILPRSTSLPIGEPELSHAIAQGAARTAFVHHVPLRNNRWTRRAVSDPTRLSGIGDRQKGKEAETATVLVPLTDARSGNHEKASPSARKDLGQVYDPLVAGRLRWALSILQRFVWAYWQLIQPVFDAKSPLRKRFDTTQSTWEDCKLWVLAAVFMFLTLSVGTWLIRLVVFVLRALKTVVDGLMVLAGF